MQGYIASVVNSEQVQLTEEFQAFIQNNLNQTNSVANSAIVLASVSVRNVALTGEALSQYQNYIQQMLAAKSTNSVVLSSVDSINVTPVNTLSSINFVA